MNRRLTNAALLVTAVVLLAAPRSRAQDGAVVRLVAPDSVSGVDTSSNQDRGIFFRTLRDFKVDAITVRLDLASAGDITATIYHAANFIRGSLVATETVSATDLGNVDHTIPFATTLDPCADYEVAVEFGAVDGWDYFDGGSATLPYARHGVALVRGASNGGSAATELPHIALVGSTLPATTTDLTPPGLVFENECHDPTTDRGVFITAQRTVAVTSIAFDYDPPGFGQPLTIKVFDGDGLTRGALLAEGTTTVPLDERRLWEVPINVILREGHTYDIAAQYNPGGWGCMYESKFTLPYVVGEAFEVVDGESGGGNNSIMTHFRIGWESQVGGVAVDLRQAPGTPPFTSTDASKTRSVYVFPVADQDLFSIGWDADVPAGETITARVYTAAGTVRGTLVSEGSIVATGGGERWLDIPVSASLSALQGYELNVAFAGVNLWRHWTVGSDYYVTPDIQVYGAGADGTGASELPHVRFNGCYDYVTAAGDRPARPTGLVLRAPQPNPATGETTIQYDLDDAGPATIDVFDVAGRHVATLLDSGHEPAGAGSVRLRASTLPAGVYFVRLSTPRATVSRKVLIVR